MSDDILFYSSAAEQQNERLKNSVLYRGEFNMS